MSDMIINGDSSSSAKYDLSQLNAFVRQFSSKYVLKVGIMGAKANRNDGGPTNADIGARHEFGSYADKLPMRSFLRMPLHSQTKQIMGEARKGALELFAKAGVKQVFNNLGVACMGAIHDAFASHGWGAWNDPPLRPSTIARKIQNNPAPLINTRQLERSVTFKVDKA